MRDPHRRRTRGRVRVIDTQMAEGYDPPSTSMAVPTTALDRYLAATVAWREAHDAREKAARDRAYALADMAQAMPVEDVARRVHLSPNRVQQLIDKAHQENT